LLNSHTTGNTHSLSHGAVALWIAILAERRRPRLPAAILVLDLKLVLQHDEVTLARLELHLLLQRGAERVERVAAGDDLLVREDPDPLQAGQDASLLLGGVEDRLGLDGSLEVGLTGGLGREDLRRGIFPGDGSVEVLGRLVGEEAHVDEDFDELGETLVAEGAADDGLRLGDVVALLVWGGVAVGVGNEGVAGVNEVWLGGSHEVLGLNLDDLAVLVVLGCVAEGEEDTAGRPGELVSERVVGILWCWETTAVGEERKDFSALGVDLLDGLDGIQVINSWVKTNLVHDCDTGILGGLVELQHGWGDIAGCDDVLLVADGGLDDRCVEGIWDQGDDEVVLCDFSIESCLVGDVERDRMGILDAFGELLCAFECTASFSMSAVE